jgi:Ice-binding-like
MKSIRSNRVVRALTPTWRSARVLIAVAMAGVLSAACDVHGVSAPGTLMSISVSPNATLVSGTTQQMVAVGYDADGRVTSISPTWSVAASGGTIASSGVFTAGTVPGLFANTVVATVGTISGRASITVTPGALATITVVPTPVTLAVTTTQQFTAVGKDASGNIVTFSPTWSVVAGGGAIDQGGIFTAGSVPGTYTNTVQASNNTIRGTATVIVTTGPLASFVVTPNPATMIGGATQQFVAVGKDAGGNVLPIASTWSVVALGGTIDGGGLFTAGATLGTFTNTVKATSGTMSGTATVIVTVGSLATITVTPNPATMTVSATQQFTAVGKDVAGNTVAITPTWAAVALGGTIDATSGMFTAGVVSGTFTNTIRATSGAISGFATVIITTGPLASITVTPNPVTLPASTTQQFVAVGRDANGNVFVISPTWSLVNFGGLINSSGLFTAGPGAGTFLNTVQATSGAISGTATVTVTVAPPPPPFVSLGTAQGKAIFGSTAVSCSSASVIGTSPGNGDVSISPAGAFTPGTCTFNGVLDQNTGTSITTRNDVINAFNILNLLPHVPANVVAGLGGGPPLLCSAVLSPCVYWSGGSIAVTGNLTLDGGGYQDAVFVFLAGSTINGEIPSHIFLQNGAKAKNVYWVAGTSSTLKTGSIWQGNILANQSIDMNASATLLGRALAINAAVTLTTLNTITLP